MGNIGNADAMRLLSLFSFCLINLLNLIVHFTTFLDSYLVNTARDPFPGGNVLHIFNNVPTPWYDLGVFSQVIPWVGRLLGNVKADRCCDFVYYLPFMEFCAWQACQFNCTPSFSMLGSSFSSISSIIANPVSRVCESVFSAACVPSLGVAGLIERLVF